jgi:hypothetical protein
VGIHPPSLRRLAVLLHVSVGGIRADLPALPAVEVGVPHVESAVRTIVVHFSGFEKPDWQPAWVSVAPAGGVDPVPAASIGQCEVHTHVAELTLDFVWRGLSGDYRMLSDSIKAVVVRPGLVVPWAKEIYLVSRQPCFLDTKFMWRFTCTLYSSGSITWSPMDMAGQTRCESTPHHRRGPARDTQP